MQLLKQGGRVAIILYADDSGIHEIHHDVDLFSRGVIPTACEYSQQDAANPSTFIGSQQLVKQVLPQCPHSS